MKSKAVLYINGDPPITYETLQEDCLYACTDGAFSYLEELGFPLHQLDFISGDLDSFPKEKLEIWKDKIIETPDQNKTDLHKAIELLKQKGVQDLTIYGASGREQDHFLGNLSTLLHWKKQMNIKAVDAYGYYFFADTKLLLEGVLGKTISLFPFPIAKNICTKGLQWTLYGENLDICHRIGTRNNAIENKVELSYDSGNLLVFVH